MLLLDTYVEILVDTEIGRKSICWRWTNTKQLEDLVSFCKESNIKTVFSESLASPKVSETLAKEVGAKVVPILTLESKEDDKSYLESMRYNLDEIYGCLKDE